MRAEIIWKDYKQKTNSSQFYTYESSPHIVRSNNLMNEQLLGRAYYESALKCDTYFLANKFDFNFNNF